MRSCVITILALCVASGSAFSSIAPKQLRRCGFRERSVTRMSTKSTDPESKEAIAVSEFKMITEEEATIRKVGGVGIGIVTAAQFALGKSTGSWSNQLRHFASSSPSSLPLP